MPPSPHRPADDDPDFASLIRLRRDLIAEGLTDNQIARLVAHGGLHRIRHGAYAGPGWLDLSVEDQHRARGRAILRTAHRSTVLTHTSSLLERRAPVWGVPIDKVHTTREVVERAGRRAPDWVPHRGRLSPDQVELLNGVRVSTATRSAMEFTTIASAESALVTVNGLMRMGAMTLGEFTAEVERCAHWPNSLVANVVLHLANPHTGSVGEDRFLYFVYRQRLPLPEAQVPVAGEAGTVFAYVDFLWRRYRVFVEFDGRLKYYVHRRPGETLEDYLLREKAREEMICQLTGWTCLRVTWDQLGQPRALARRIGRVLASRGFDEHDAPTALLAPSGDEVA